jgi:cytochrome c oxidase subunit 3
MWIFLATELLLFGSLLTSFAVYSALYPSVFQDASRHLNLTLGAINTVVLLVSSVLVALAVRAARIGARRQVTWLLIGTIALGAVFLALKLVEYLEHYRAHLAPGFGFAFPGPQAEHAELFFVLYFIMTGVHAVHLTIGIVLMAIMLFLARRRQVSRENYVPLELSGLYWHFVDIVWVFLYPLLYLAGRH